MVATLEALACWAGRFTPRVALTPPRALLIEIGGCLRYFGGIENILAEAADGLAEQDFYARMAVAPTPQGALWLAQANAAALCRDGLMLAAALDALPLAPLDLPEAVKEKLENFGARRLGQARRLPHAGLARRIGADAVAAIARAYGELPDPRRDFVFPPRFAQELELPAAVDSASALLFAAQRLVAALSGWLEVRQGGVASCTLHLRRPRRESDAVELRFAAATRDAARIGRVLHERIERLALAAPVTGLLLTADAVVALPGRSGVLFAGAETASEGMGALVERLRARLGDACVHGIAPQADHRPECATRRVAQGQGGAAASAQRPFWLLAAPEALPERGGRPWRDGPLRLLAGPERIESGWWDADDGTGDARRDYFVALTTDARWAWIFRELRAPGGWFLHGWFG